MFDTKISKNYSGILQNVETLKSSFITNICTDLQFPFKVNRNDEINGKTHFQYIPIVFSSEVRDQQNVIIIQRFSMILTVKL